jgi:hypothetical protein
MSVARKRSSVLNGSVAYALLRAKFGYRTVFANDQGACGARVDALPARTAAAGCRLVWLESFAQQQQADKEPAAPLRIDEHRVLSEPAYSRLKGEISLQDRC